MKRFSILIVLIASGFTSLFGYYSEFLCVDKTTAESQYLSHPRSFGLAQAALIASGVPDASIPAYMTLLTELSKRSRETAAAQASVRQKAGAIFSLIQKSVLKEYRLNATTLDTLLRDGRYNCISATILYNYLLTENGITCQAVILPECEHIFTLINTGNERIEAENTFAGGFDMAKNPEAWKSLKAIRKVDAASFLSNRITVGNEALSALIYANRAYFADRSGDSESGFQLMLRAEAAYPDEPFIRFNLRNAYLSFSKTLIRQKRMMEAMDILEEAILKLNITSGTTENYLYALDAAIQKEAAQGNISGAFRLLERGKAAVGGNTEKIEENLYIAWLFRQIDRCEPSASVYETAKVAVRKFPQSIYIQSLVMKSINRIYLDLIADWKRYPEGEKLFLDWMDLVQGTNRAKLIPLAESYYVGIAMKKYDQGRKAESLTILMRGLTVFPKSAIIGNAMHTLSEKAATESLTGGDFAAAEYYARLGLKAMPKDADLQGQLLEIYRNWSAELMAREQDEDARKLIREAILLFPNDKKLGEYLKFLNKKSPE